MKCHNIKGERVGEGSSGSKVRCITATLATLDSVTSFIMEVESCKENEKKKKRKERRENADSLVAKTPVVVELGHVPDPAQAKRSAQRGMAPHLQSRIKSSEVELRQLPLPCPSELSTHWLTDCLAFA